MIPTIGRRELARALRSVTNQDDPADEVIVVDNGDDPDEARDIVSDVAPTAELISISPWSGPGPARNAGARHSSSQWIAFLDDDDEYDPDYLSVLRKTIDAHQPDVVYGSKVFMRDGQVEYTKALDSEPQDRWLQLLLSHRNHGVGGQNLAARREVFERLGGFPALPTGQDRAFAIAALRADVAVTFVADAVVRCHPPVGYRAKGDPRRWRAWWWITRTHWSAMSWPTRVVALGRVAKSAAGSLRR